MAVAVPFFINQYNFPLFHALVEAIVVIVASSILLVYINMRSFIDSGFFLISAVGFLFMAALELLHLFSFDSMGIFPGRDENLTTQFWIAARLYQSLALLCATFFFQKKLRILPVVLVQLLVFLAMLVAIYPLKIFPVYYVEGKGITWFKQISDILISLVFLMGLVMVLRNRKVLDPEITRLVAWAMVTNIAAEIWIVLFTDEQGIPLATGHIFEIITFFLFYRAFVKKSLEIPRKMIERLEWNQRELKASEERFRLLYETSPLGYQSLDEDGRFLTVNPTWQKMMGYSQQEVAGRWFGDFLAPEYMPEFNQYFAQYKAAGQIRDAQYELIRKDGSHFYAEIDGNIGFDEQGNFKQTHCVLRDITARRLAEERIQTSLQEKEVMLREIHHRVKNNLQMIASMLDLQSQHTHDARDAALFRDSKERIYSIALVHERLYRSVNLADIDFIAYLQDLVYQIETVYREQIQIRLDTRVPRFNVDIEKAVPFGLLVNELVTNAFQHAYPDDRIGTILIYLEALDGEEHAGMRYRLTISDDGVGLPEELQPDKPVSMGLMLVQLLVKQLDAELTWFTHPGTTWQISFKAENV